MRGMIHGRRRANLRRRTTLALGAAAMAVAAVVLIFCREDLLERYYLWALERDGGALAKLIDADRPGAAWRAMERHVRTPRGREATLGLYLELAKQVGQLDSLHHVSVYDTWILCWSSRGRWAHWLYTDIRNGSFPGLGSTTQFGLPSDTRKLEAVQELLLAGSVERATHPDYPGLEFTLLFREVMERDRATYRFLDWSEWPAGCVLVAARKGTGQATSAAPLSR